MDFRRQMNDFFAQIYRQNELYDIWAKQNRMKPSTVVLASEETVSREFGAYDRIRDNFPKYVVSLDELDMSRNGIKHRNIRDFLLTEEWN